MALDEDSCANTGATHRQINRIVMICTVLFIILSILKVIQYYSFENPVSFCIYLNEALKAFSACQDQQPTEGLKSLDIVSPE